MIGYYVGIDIAEGSVSWLLSKWIKNSTSVFCLKFLCIWLVQIEDCRTRYNGDADHHHRHKKYSFPARLLCGDCFEVNDQVVSSSLELWIGYFQMDDTKTLFRFFMFYKHHFLDFQIELDKILEEDASFDICSCQVLYASVSFFFCSRFWVLSCFPKLLRKPKWVNIWT